MHHTVRTEEATAIADINVTPLVDVMLCLLIIFMIAMPTLTGSVPLDMPQVGPTPPVPIEPEPPMLVHIRADGRLFLQGRPIDADVLSAEMRYQLARDPDRVLSIDADRDAQYQQVLDVLAAARDQGVHRISMPGPALASN